METVDFSIFYAYLCNMEVNQYKLAYCSNGRPDSLEAQLFSRTIRLVGEEAMQCISRQRVIIFGVGGVGSWVAEGLVRSGIRHLTIVDRDCIDVTNVNRQCPALVSTVGMPKVEVMKSRLLAINPQAEVEAIEDVYDATTRDRYSLADYDYIIDAIDSLSCKAELILHATSLPDDVHFFSSMGAAMKLDASQVSTDEFWRVKGCPLARALRQYFKRHQRFPSRKFRVVYSPEVVPNRGTLLDGATPFNGTLVHTTAIFGFTLVGLVLQEILREPENHK